MIVKAGVKEDVVGPEQYLTGFAAAKGLRDRPVHVLARADGDPRRFATVVNLYLEEGAVFELGRHTRNVIVKGGVNS